MRRLYFLTFLLLIIILFGVFIINKRSVNLPEEKMEISPAETELITTQTNMKLTSHAFEHNNSIPAIYTCDGENVSPPLAISEVPENAKSLVLIMDDPDVPKNLRADGTWDHWIVFNIPPTATELQAGEEPQGVHGQGTSGNSDYNGPCPPDKEHRYFFKLYALDTELTLIEGATKQKVEQAMQGHILEQTELVGLYQRQ